MGEVRLSIAACNARRLPDAMRWLGKQQGHAEGLATAMAALVPGAPPCPPVSDTRLAQHNVNLVSALARQMREERAALAVARAELSGRVGGREGRKW